MAAEAEEGFLLVQAYSHVSPFPGGVQSHLSNLPLSLKHHGHYLITSTTPCDVKIRLWGAGGGGSTYSGPCRGSAGGYTEAVVSLSQDQPYTLLIGEGGGGGGYGTVKQGDQSPAYPDGSISGIFKEFHHGGGGGGSTRFARGQIPSSLINDLQTSYLLVAGGGAGGIDYATNAVGPTFGEGGGVSGGSGGFRFAAPGGEGVASPGGGGGHAAGGTGGSGGRLANGSPGTKYMAGLSTGGGAGGGYYGGGGASGYYSQGGGGSGFFDAHQTEQGMTISGGTGITSGAHPHYESFPLERPLPSTGVGGTTLVGNGKGGDGGCLITLLRPFVPAPQLLLISIEKIGSLHTEHGGDVFVTFTVSQLEESKCRIQLERQGVTYEADVMLPLMDLRAPYGNDPHSKWLFFYSKDLDRFSVSYESHSLPLPDIILHRART